MCGFTHSATLCGAFFQLKSNDVLIEYLKSFRNVWMVWYGNTSMSIWYVLSKTATCTVINRKWVQSKCIPTIGITHSNEYIIFSYILYVNKCTVYWDCFDNRFWNGWARLVSLECDLELFEVKGFARTFEILHSFCLSHFEFVFRIFLDLDRSKSRRQFLTLIDSS